MRSKHPHRRHLLGGESGQGAYAGAAAVGNPDLLHHDVTVLDETIPGRGLKPHGREGRAELCGEGQQQHGLQAGLDVLLLVFHRVMHV